MTAVGRGKGGAETILENHTGEGREEEGESEKKRPQHGA